MIILPDGRKTTFEGIALLYDIPSYKFELGIDYIILLNEIGGIKCEMTANIDGSVQTDMTLIEDDNYQMSVKCSSQDSINQAMQDLFASIASIITTKYLLKDQDDSDIINDWLSHNLKEYRNDSRKNKIATYSGHGTENFLEFCQRIHGMLKEFYDPALKQENEIMNIFFNLKKKISEFKDEVPPDRYKKLMESMKL